MTFQLLTESLSGEIAMTVDRKNLIDSRTHCMDLQSNEIAVQSLDFSGSIIDVSPAWLKLMGYKRDEVIGRHFFEFLSKDALIYASECFPHLTDFGFVDNIPLKIKRKNDAFVLVSLTGTSTYDVNGVFKRTYCELKCLPL